MLSKPKGDVFENNWSMISYLNVNNQEIRNRSDKISTGTETNAGEKTEKVISLIC